MQHFEKTVGKVAMFFSKKELKKELLLFLKYFHNLDKNDM